MRLIISVPYTIKNNPVHILQDSLKKTRKNKNHSAVSDRSCTQINNTIYSDIVYVSIYVRFNNIYTPGVSVSPGQRADIQKR